MIGQRYHEAKTAVLDVCKRYLRFRGDTEDGVDVKFLETRIKEVEDGRYVLAVVGEVKAGKSTFINALLGERILPTDVLQSSSAIVEICKSEKKYVRAHYANRHDETVHDDPSTPNLDEASEYLRQIGTVKDEYRISQGYEEDRPPAGIPTKITFGFPLKYAFDGLRLVDSPGVNAVGGFQEATHEYIREANAVLFVHSLESPVESSSFSDFINQVVPNRTRETLFLVLTKSGGRSKIETDEKVGEARRQYDKEFDQRRVLHVDSMLKIVSDEIKGFDSATSLKEYYREQKKHFEAKYEREQSREWRDEAVNFDIKLRLLTNVLNDVGDDPDRETVQSELRKLSNFDEMERLIDAFSSRAPQIQLSNLLDSVKSGYDNQTAHYEQNLDVWKKKRKRPQTFENEISKIQNHLGDYQNSMSDFADCVAREFTGVNAAYSDSLKQLRDEHSNQIRSATSLDAAKRELENFGNSIRSLGDDVAAAIRTRFKEELERLGREFKTKYSITMPTIDISAIDLKAKQKAYDKYDVPRSPKGAWEWTQKILTVGLKKFTEKKERYNESKHLSNFQSDAIKIIRETSGEFPNLVSSLVSNYEKSFKSDLKTLIDSRTRTLEDIRKSKAENAQILANIAATKQKKKVIATEVTRIDDMLGDIR